ncbi:DUF2937 family protein [Amylibacter sp. IMCC11727]|uniref:DUF2937 family protein n=1 Tax=Amylibacter sp. IMCC11727 TaxID=3039851 RepID=UPI00244DAECC|nr:DUF2937 family protein [Amylibacter sp. IMCC11727]WGI22913.1 DUF2937 family protein [Amylibacter sp. IMCC11727]
MGRVINLCGGAALLVGASQFPEFSQQYVQRLGGAVDELRLVAADFDKSATSVGMTREEALASMTGNDFQVARRTDMIRSFKRLYRLESDLIALEGADAFTRLRHVFRFSDSGIVARAWAAYRPAIPIDFDGLIFALGGFFAGFGLFAGLGRVFRRNKTPEVKRRIEDVNP